MSLPGHSSLHAQGCHVGSKSDPKSTQVSSKATSSISEQKTSRNKAFMGHITRFQIRKTLRPPTYFVKGTARVSIATHGSAVFAYQVFGCQGPLGFPEPW